MARYEYYVVEGSFVVRWGRGGAERLTEDGRWVDYPDTWDVATNGRQVKGGEAEALAAAKRISDGLRRREAGERAVEACRERGPSRAVQELLEPGPDGRESMRAVGRLARVSVRTCRLPVPAGARAVEARISPDGGRVAVAWAGAGGAGIDAAESDGEGDGQALVRLGEERPAELAWSPEGTHLAYRIGGGSAIQDQVAWIDTRAPMGEQVRVAGTVFSWQSGDRGLYVGYGPYADIARHDVTTGERRPLVYYHTYLPRDFRARILLSPSGNRLAFTTREVPDDESWLYVFDLETEDLRAVARVPRADAHLLPCWSPDGDALGLYVVHGPSETAGLLMFGLVDGSEELLYRSESAGALCSPAWSPDGRSIAFFGDGALLLLDLETRSPDRLCEPGLVSGDLHFIDERRLAVDGGAGAHLLALG